MNQKEKAKDLIEKYMPYANGIDEQEDHDQIEEHLENAKQCALIAIYEIFNILPDAPEFWEYWEEVKKEIEKI
jgi:hypothetical protein